MVARMASTVAKALMELMIYFYTLVCPQLTIGGDLLQGAIVSIGKLHSPPLAFSWS